ncbi:MAG: aldo/keto reductase [Spongiibacteraceae bacterium]|nr:aldo/keto reductase [Spongiibacteraceae bacterium]
MPSRKLGPFSVSAIGLGCMSMSHGYGKPDKQKATKTLNKALDLGYNFLDTAALYGFGHNESLIGEVLASRRNEYVLASECGLIRGDDGKRSLNGRPDVIKKTCEDSLRRLKTDVIDLYYLHRVDPNVPVEDSVGALSDLVAQGKIKTIGLSEVNVTTLRRAHAVHPITALQSEYSLWTRNPEGEVLKACEEMGVSFVAFSPLGRAFLTGKVRDMSLLEENDLRQTMPRFQAQNFIENLTLLATFADIAKAEECSMAQLSLAWVLAQGDNIIPIPGTQHPEHAEENLASVHIDLNQRCQTNLNQLINANVVQGDRYSPAIMASMET